MGRERESRLYSHEGVNGRVCRIKRREEEGLIPREVAVEFIPATLFCLFIGAFGIRSLIVDLLVVDPFLYS